MDDIHFRAGQFATVVDCLKGLSKGLSSFSGPSRVALIVGLRPDIPLVIYDPQELLEGYKKEIEQYYSNTEAWQNNLFGTGNVRGYMAKGLSSLNLDRLITVGYCSTWFFHQMWFTELHSNMVFQGTYSKMAVACREFAIIGKLSLGKGMELCAVPGNRSRMECRAGDYSSYSRQTASYLG